MKTIPKKLTGPFPAKWLPQMLEACSCSTSSAKKASRSISFWLRRTSSSALCSAALFARVKLPTALILPRVFLFRGRVKSWNSRIRFLFCWLTEIKCPFFSLGSSKIVSKLLVKKKNRIHEYLSSSHLTLTGRLGDFITQVNNSKLLYFYSPSTPLVMLSAPYTSYNAHYCQLHRHLGTISLYFSSKAQL